ncbi:uncharacterized protein TRIADDRAFT_24833 [Trichoplax adhaerens]|uniref:rRNA adenine N(6)-methyltransferase n=1 Tax=Trichoplax adhaerens TaxID=10228 RepID=B3RWS2_TRIAD|nr:hypothetical protein TRIADDRAFT_24833 [Trichoplax adhaerens]EDV24751.1 hypothetical protein TRIADDRAFT_24833 [Trichoplax adhaerens]|eukprot:XP_002112641.1 hypothetical protein TRIADDRAFT_24833 [Trichoplax adhaerens]
MIRLPPLPTIRDLIKLHNLSASKQLSQNFLLNSNITNKIVLLDGGVENHQVCEVGAGPGCLTRSIIAGGASKIVAVEKDRRFLPALDILANAVDGRMVIVYADILNYEMIKAFDPVDKKAWNDESPKMKIIGNLPFSISTPLLIQWLNLISQNAGPFSLGRIKMTLTFQEEVAQRILAEPKTSQRSRLSIMTQNYCHVKPGFLIKGSSFVPAPKVNSVVLTFTPRITPLIDIDFTTLEVIAKSLFRHRRKFVIKGTKYLFPTDVDLSLKLFEEADVDWKLRPQQLSTEEIQRLCAAYKKVLLDHQLDLSDAMIVKETNK